MQYYIYQKEEQKGPYSKSQIVSMYNESEINEETLVWNKDYSDWKKLSESEFYSNSNTNEGDISEVFSNLSNDKQNVSFKLLNNEKLLNKLKFNSGEAIVTNFRLYFRTSNFTKEYINSIHLESISSVEYATKGKLWLLILAFLSIVLGIGSVSEMGSMSYFIIGFLLFVIFMFLYYWTRKKFITVTPNGGSSINIKSEGFSNIKVSDFIDSIHFAKVNRTNQSNK